MKKVVAAVLVFLIFNASTTARAANETQKPSVWPMRYVIFVDTERWYQAGVENWKDNPKRKGWMEGFIPAFFVKTQGTKGRLAAMRIDFDGSGKVISKVLNDVPLSGMLTKSKRLELVTPAGFSPSWLITKSTYLEPYQYDPNNGDQDWEEGRMTFCNHREMERLQIEMINDVDGPTEEYKLEPEEGLFYCNDWSRQLANPDRPWIDVTSYEKHGPRVRKFQGYGLFGVTKPVVGKHYKTWICFADCPDGKTGPISDIKAWSKQYRLPVENRSFGFE
jgi:hypothetical protein